MGDPARLVTERISRLPSDERIALAVMWASVLVFGPPALVLTALHDPENLPIALTVIIGGTLTSAIATVLILRRSPRASRAPEEAGKRIER